jgi:hypothetical protein
VLPPSSGISSLIMDSSLMMEAARTSETSVDNHFTRQYNPEDSSEHLLHGVGHDCDLTVVLQYVIVLGLTVKTALCSIILCGNFSGSRNPNFKNANYIVEVISEMKINVHFASALGNYNNVSWALSLRRPASIT